MNKLKAILLLAVLSWILNFPAFAQYRSLHNFNVWSDDLTIFINSETNSDGLWPVGPLAISGNVLYGTTSQGTSNATGNIFSIHTDGTQFTVLHVFGRPTGIVGYPFPTYANADGAQPDAGLIVTNGVIYGTTSSGGSNASGVIFSLDTDGGSFSNLYSFSGGADGTYPNGTLVMTGNTLFGTTSGGGISNNGTIFAINTDGTRFTNLFFFTNGLDGVNPMAGVIVSSNILYGTTSSGGVSNAGTIFAIQTNGTGFTNLYEFLDGLDGHYPAAPLFLSDNILYGTAMDIPPFLAGSGVLFKIKTDGTGFTNIYNILGGGEGTSAAFPSLVLWGNTLFTTTTGGSGGYGANLSGAGTLAIHTDGSNPAQFGGWPRYTGSKPYYNWNGSASALIRSGNTFYGTAYAGDGPFYSGTVFSFTFPVVLTSLISGTNLIISWPTNSGPFETFPLVLQYSSNPYTSSMWSNVPIIPAVVAGQYIVTNPIIATGQMFYRLSH